jgi:parvulin-like peptidyl-prolyl isomerase
MDETVRRKALLASVMALVLLASAGCGLVQVNEERDAQTVVAVVGDTKLLKGDFNKLYASNKANAGITDEIEQSGDYTDEINKFKNQVVDYMVEEELALQEAARRGITLTPEEDQKVQDDVNEMLEYYRSIFRQSLAASATPAPTATPDPNASPSASATAEPSATPEPSASATAEPSATPEPSASATAEPSATPEPSASATPAPSATPEPTATAAPSATPEVDEAQVEELLQNYLAQIGMSQEELVANARTEAVINKLYEDVSKDVTVDQTAVDTLYQQKVEADKTKYEGTPSSYEKAMQQGTTIYYHPAGYRYVRHILVKFPDDVASQISTLRSNGDTEGADALRTEELKKLQPEAEAALARVQGGEDFVTVMNELSDDPGSKSYPDGYVLGSASTSYVAEFVSGAMQLSKPGDVSGLVASDYGYHIIQYAKDAPSGATPYEEVSDALYTEALNEQKYEVYQAELEKWMAATKVKKYYDRVH